MLVARCESHVLERPLEVPVLLGRVLVADDADVARVAHAESLLVSEPHEPHVAHGVEPHQLGGDRIDGDLIGGRQKHVLDVRDHAARTGAIPGERAVHHREHAAVDLLLDHQQVHQRLVDDRVRPVTMLVEQPPERVLHRAGGGRENVGLHRRQVDDVLSDEPPRNAEPVRIDLVQTQEAIRQVAHRVAYVDPVLALVQVHVAQAMLGDDVNLFVLSLPEVRVDDHGPVVTAVDQGGVVAVLLHGTDHAFELPGRGRGRRVEEVPGDVDLESRVTRAVDGLLVAREVHEPVVVLEHGGRLSAQDGDGR